MEQLKILVVDDEERMRKLVNDFLTRKQYKVVEAADGEEAINLFIKNNDFDLIILDPPYKSGLYEKVLPIIYDKKLVSADGIVVCEHASGDEFDYGNFQVFDEKKYGNITLTYLKI